MVRTPEETDFEIKSKQVLTAATFESVDDIEGDLIANHAKHVIKMLPGGMSILGAFICSPNNIFNENSTISKAKSILHYLHREFTNEPLLNAGSLLSEQLMLHFNTTDSQ